MRLTPHFTFEEMTHSQTAARLGIRNLPSNESLHRLKITCQKLEIVRGIVGKPIIVLSGFRSKELNFAVGGSKNSQHMVGEAADIICPSYGSPFQLAKTIKENMYHIGVDQMIYEFRHWVHISFSRYPRGQLLTIHSRQEGYKAGLFI